MYLTTSSITKTNKLKTKQTYIVQLYVLSKQTICITVYNYAYELNINNLIICTFDMWLKKILQDLHYRNTLTWLGEWTSGNF